MNKTFLLGSSLSICCIAGIVGGTFVAHAATNTLTPDQAKQRLLQQQQNLIKEKNSKLAPANSLAIPSKPILTEPAADRVVKKGPVTMVPGWRVNKTQSAWLDGSKHNANYTIWDPFVVWSGTENGTPVIATFVIGASNSDFSKYAQTFNCPENVGSITITGINGDLVGFSSGSGSNGTLNLARDKWKFTN